MILYRDVGILCSVFKIEVEYYFHKEFNSIFFVNIIPADLLNYIKCVYNIIVTYHFIKCIR